MKLLPTGKWGPLLIAMLVFLVVFAPLGWLFTRMRQVATVRDDEKLNELVTNVRRVLMAEGLTHQRLLQTWRKRIDALEGPLDQNAWNRILKGPRSLALGRFRAVGYAESEEGGRWVVRFIESHESQEQISVGTDLAIFPEIRAALVKRDSIMPGAVIRVDSVTLPEIGERNLVFNRTSLRPGEEGVVFATILAEDFLAPVVTVWKRTEDSEDAGSEVIQKEYLPGVGEGQVTIESIPQHGRVPAGHLPENVLDNGMGVLHLVFHPGPKFPSSSQEIEAWFVLGCGGFVALLLSIIAWNQACQRGRLQTQVASRTSELREANAVLGLYKAIVETTSDLVGLSEMDGTPVFMNRAGRVMLGIAPEESLEAFPLGRLYPPDVLERFASEGIPHAMEHGSWSAEIMMCRRDGREIPVSFVGVVIRSSDGESLNLGFIARDITAKREMDQQMQESLAHEQELVKMKSQFVNTVSHEFRTPLGVILSSAELLTHYMDRMSVDQRSERLRDIQDSSLQMSRMLEEVLSLAGLENGRSACNAKPLNLASLLLRIVDENRSANGGNVVLSIDGLIDEASVDEGLLRHILLNLLSNACKYSASDEQVEFSAARDSNDVVLVVRDHGIGIPAEDIAHIFEAFTRASNVEDARGTGLGLTIVERCVTMHNGTIQLESIAGEGTTVRVRLPVFDSDQS